MVTPAPLDVGSVPPIFPSKSATAPTPAAALPASSTPSGQSFSRLFRPQPQPKPSLLQLNAATPMASSSSSASFSSPTTPQTPRLIYHRLPHYYPQYCHDYNRKLAEISKIVQVSNFLEVPPFLLCLIISSLICVALFAKFLVNIIIITAVVISTFYTCLCTTSGQGQIFFSQVFNITLSLMLLCCYLIFSPWIDHFLDWIPFYHTIKLFIAVSFSLKAESNTASPESSPFPITDDSFPLSNQRQDPNTDGFVLNNLALYSFSSSTPSIPQLPSIIITGIRMFRALYLWGYCYVLHQLRSAFWRLRTWAYTIKVGYQESRQTDDFDLVASNAGANDDHQNDPNIQQYQERQILRDYDHLDDFDGDFPDDENQSRFPADNDNQPDRDLNLPSDASNNQNVLNDSDSESCSSYEE